MRLAVRLASVARHKRHARVADSRRKPLHKVKQGIAEKNLPGFFPLRFKKNATYMPEADCSFWRLNLIIQIEDAFSEQTGAFVPFPAHIEPLPDPLGLQQGPFTELAHMQHIASALLTKGSAQFAAQLGRAACHTLSDELHRALAWAAVHFAPNHGHFEAFAGAALRTAVLRFYRRFSPMALVRERRDQIKRDDAVQKGPLAQARFVDEVLCRLKGLQRRAPQLWYVEGAHPDDVGQEVAREILESMAQGTSGFERYERPGREATLVLLETVRSRIRRECRRQIARHSPVGTGMNLADPRTPVGASHEVLPGAANATWLALSVPHEVPAHQAKPDGSASQ